MSKSPDIVRSAAAITPIVSQISDVLAESEQLAKIILDNVMYKMRRQMAELIVTASRNARLSGVDAMIYDTYRDMITYCGMSIKRYEECERMILNSQVKTIIDGIYSVLKSELHGKEEDRSPGENPVLQEKKAIVSKGITFFSKAIESKCDSFTESGIHAVRKKILEIIPSCVSANCLPINDTVTAEIASAAVEIINEECMDDFKAYFSDSMKYCVSSLNDLESRKTTSYYYDLLVKGYETLSSIVKNPIAVIENKKSGGADEKMAVDSILTHLLEGYQYLSKSMNEIKTCFNVTYDDIALDITLMPGFEHFEGIANDLYRNKKIKEASRALDRSVSGLMEGILEWVKQEIEGELFERHLRKKAYGYSLGVTQILDMTDEMIDAFKVIISFYESTSGNYQDDNSLDIIKGIYETISIKIECLEENKTHFKEMIADALSELKACKIDVDSAGLGDEALTAFKKLIASESSDISMPVYEKDGKIEKKYQKHVINVMNESFADIISKSSEDFEKKTAIYDGMIEKREFAFKKDYLLYEVSTFEEILQYSVSRLAEDPHPAVAAFVEAAYDSSKLVGIVLKKNGILQIKPEPHEMFNSKEHEVLMVEKNHDFNKGEVIKMMNSGYKQYDTVIIRANIIAAT